MPRLSLSALNFNSKKTLHSVFIQFSITSMTLRINADALVIIRG